MLKIVYTTRPVSVHMSHWFIMTLKLRVIEAEAEITRIRACRERSSSYSLHTVKSISVITMSLWMVFVVSYQDNHVIRSSNIDYMYTLHTD